jgi:peptidoglycan hydrolase CwlO-like protein
MDGKQLGLLESLDKGIRSLLKKAQDTSKDFHEEIADMKELREELKLKI